MDVCLCLGKDIVTVQIPKSLRRESELQEKNRLVERVPLRQVHGVTPADGEDGGNVRGEHR